MSLFNFNEILEEMSYEYNDDLVESGYPLEECGDTILSEFFIEEYVPVIESTYVMQAELLTQNIITESSVKSFWENVKKFFKTIWEKIKSFFQWIKNLFKKKGKEVQEETKEAVKSSEEVKKILMLPAPSIKQLSAPKSEGGSVGGSSNSEAKADAQKVISYANNNLLTEEDKKNPKLLYASIYENPSNLQKFIDDNCKIVKSAKSGIVLDGGAKTYNLQKMLSSDMGNDIVTPLTNAVRFLTIYIRRPDIAAKHDDDEKKEDMVDFFGELKKVYSLLNVQLGRPVSSENILKYYGEMGDETISKGDFLKITSTGGGEIQQKIYKQMDAMNKINQMIDSAVQEVSKKPTTDPKLMGMYNQAIEQSKHCINILRELISVNSKALNESISVYRQALREIRPVLAFIK